jgi:hypothetical protein
MITPKREPRADWRIKSMTVCIAALCNKRKTLILAADKMIGSVMIETEAEIQKITKLHRDWWVMLAGNDVSPAFDIIDACKQQMNAHKPKTVKDAIKAVEICYRQKRQDEAESIYLIPRGWTPKDFNSPKSSILPETTRAALQSRIDAYELDVNLLIAGFDVSRVGHVFTVSDADNRAVARRHDIPGFASIGSGRHGADYMMTYRELSPAMPTRLVLYYVVEGKYYGELASGVGPRTDLYILRPGGKALKMKETTLDKKLFKICDSLSPRGVREKQVEILNSIKGPFMDTIEKLRTHRDGQDLVIETERTRTRQSASRKSRGQP